MEAYNYTIAEEYKQKIYIPIIGVELEGRGTILLSLLGLCAGTLSMGLILSFFLDDTAYLFSFCLSSLFVLIALFYAREIDTRSGRNKMSEFYYLYLRKYRCIIDSKGIKHYLPPKTEGVIYHVCRTRTPLWKRRVIQ